MAKPVRFTAHAETVLRERRLEREWIERAAQSPEWTESDRANPEAERRFRAVPERDGRILRVVCVETGSEIRIISAFLDRKARRPE
ncbi:MAG: DUF4258 domain-containing protein [Rhizobiaceae bacterium]|nr:DUF4258 domain-containing protein [Rhizobiaceae bacterium]